MDFEKLNKLSCSFNTWCNFLQENAVMTSNMCFACYEDEILPPFVGDIECIEFKDNKRVTPRTFDKRRLYL